MHKKAKTHLSKPEMQSRNQEQVKDKKQKQRVGGD